MTFFKILTILIFILNCNNTFSNNFETHTLEIEFLGLENSNGKMVVILYNDKQEKLKTISSEIKNNKCIILVNNLKKGIYAIKYFHDENKNNIWDKNFLGMPIEGFGYSNNAMKKFSEPDFNEWLFSIYSAKKIDLNIKYILR